MPKQTKMEGVSEQPKVATTPHAQTPREVRAKKDFVLNNGNQRLIALAKGDVINTQQLSFFGVYLADHGVIDADEFNKNKPEGK